MTLISNKHLTNFVNDPKLRKIATSLCTKTGFLPVILLESTVIAGRTHQAHKRGGPIEARERVTEESISSVVWLGGIPALNKLGDLIIKNVLKVKDFTFDIGKDSIRNPMKNAIGHLPKNQQNYLMGLKLGKIVLSSAASVYFMGMILPKLNQKATSKILEEKKRDAQLKQQEQKNRSASIKHLKRAIKPVPMKEFMKRTDKIHSDVKVKQALTPSEMEDFLSKNRKDSKVSFKGFENIANTILYNLEKNPICGLMTLDSGLFAGRTYNARNNYERIEILFRDLSSSFFYLFSTNLIVSALCKLDPHQGKNTRLDPETAHHATKLLNRWMEKQPEVSVETFEKGMLGSEVVPQNLIYSADTLQKDGIVNVSNLNEFIDKRITDKKIAQSLKNKALDLSTLQPKKAGEAIITDTQIKNVFSDGLLNDPDFMNNLINTATRKKAFDETKFVSQRQIEKIKGQITDYVQSIITQAKKEKIEEITPDFLQKMKNRNMLTKMGFWGVGMGISALFLSTIIPKTQYYISKRLSKTDGFIGIADIEDDTIFKGKNPKNQQPQA